MFGAIQVNSIRREDLPSGIAARGPEIFASERGNSAATLLSGSAVGAVNSINPIVTHSLRQMTRAITRNGVLCRRVQRAQFHFNKRGTFRNLFGEAIEKRERERELNSARTFARSNAERTFAPAETRLVSTRGNGKSSRVSQPRAARLISARHDSA